MVGKSCMKMKSLLKIIFDLFVSCPQEYTLSALTRWKTQFFNLNLDITIVAKSAIVHWRMSCLTNVQNHQMVMYSTNIIKIVNGSSVSQFANLGLALERKIKAFGTLRRPKDTLIKYKPNSVKELEKVRDKSCGILHNPIKT